MPTQVLTINNAKVGMIFADIDEACFDGLPEDVPGSLYEIVEVVNAEQNFNGQAHVRAVCVDYDDSDEEPRSFSFPLRCYVQSPFVEQLAEQ